MMYAFEGKAPRIHPTAFAAPGATVIGDVELGEDVVVGHMAMLHSCTVADACLVGMSATVLSGSTVGEGSIVAGGAVVLQGQEIGPYSLVAGVPAQVKRQLGPETRADRVRHAAAYVDLAGRYRAGLTRIDAP